MSLSPFPSESVGVSSLLPITFELFVHLKGKEIWDVVAVSRD